VAGLKKLLELSPMVLSGTISITGTATVTLSTGNFVNNNTSASVNFGASNITVNGTAQSVGGFTTTGRFSATNTSRNSYAHRECEIRRG
jgi:hypothetical protein